jgi:hypothetical protein
MLYRLQSSTPSTNTNNVDGTAGTSVGSSIGGLARRSGGKMGRNHCLYLPVGIANEYNASRTYSTCFYSIIHPMIRKFIKGTWKTVTNKALHYVSCKQQEP